MNKFNNFSLFIKSILPPIIVGILVGIITKPFMDYTALNKPPLSPTGYIFPIVWFILYLLMGISYYILEKNNKMTFSINKIYYIQLITNAMWSIFFFVFKVRLFSFFWIIFLICLIIYMIYLMYKQNKISAYIQTPYLLWCVFASYLNIAIWYLN